MFKKDVNPLFHTPAAITRSVNDMFGGRKTSSANMVAAMAVTLFTATTAPVRGSYRLKGTNGLKERVKSLEKQLQLHPTRNDIKLEIIEVRKQIRAIEAENRQAKAALNPKKKKK